MKALLRRYDALGSIRETKSENQIQVGNIVLDTAKKQLVVRGEAVRLTATEFKILLVLMSNLGKRCLRRGKYRHGTHQSYPRKTGDQSKEAGISESCLGDWICL